MSALSFWIPILVVLAIVWGVAIWAYRRYAKMGVGLVIAGATTALSVGLGLAYTAPAGKVVIESGQPVISKQARMMNHRSWFSCDGSVANYTKGEDHPPYPLITIEWGETDEQKLEVFSAATAENLIPLDYMTAVAKRAVYSLPYFKGDRTKLLDRIAYRRALEAKVRREVPGSRVVVDFGLRELDKGGS